MRPLFALALIAACGGGHHPMVPSPDGAVPLDAFAPGPRITTFVFRAADNPGLARDVPAHIRRTWIAADLPPGVSLAGLIPTFVATAGASVTVNDTPQTSGTTANDYTNKVIYRVTDDSGTADFSVVVDVGGVPTGIAIDGAGNTYLAGYTPVAISGATNQGGYDLFVIKTDATGARVWGTQIGSTPQAGVTNSDQDWALAVAVDGSNNIYVGGETTGNLDGTRPGNGATYEYDAYVLKLDSTGAVTWIRQIASAPTVTIDQPQDVVTSVTADASGAIYLAGQTDGNLDGNTHIGPEQFNNFVSQYDAATGAQIWTTLLDPYSAGNTYVAVDSSGVYAASARFTATGTSPDPTDVHVAKYDTAGHLVWDRVLGSDAEDGLDTVGTDASGSVHIAGSTMGSIDGNPHVGVWSVWAATYDLSGTQQWVYELPGDPAEHATCSALGGSESWEGFTDAAGNTYAVGLTTSNLDGQTNAGGCSDGFVVKIQPDGTKGWVRLIGTPDNEVSSCVGADAAGNVFVGTQSGGETTGHMSIDMFDAAGNPE